MNANIKGIADRIAADGYIALARDLYHGQVGAEPDEEQKLMMAMSREQAMKDLNGAVAALDDRGDVDSWKIGVTGFCMGGGLARALAIENSKTRVCAPFYGLPMGGIEGVKNIKGSVLGFYGAKDAHITPARVEELRSALQAAGIEHALVIYPDADHAFSMTARLRSTQALLRTHGPVSWISSICACGTTRRSILEVRQRVTQNHPPLTAGVCNSSYDCRTCVWDR